MASIKEVILPSGNAYEFRDAITHVDLTQAEYDALVAAGAVDNDKVYFITDGDAPAASASDVTYSNTQSGLSATNVQDAIDVVNAVVSSISPITPLPTIAGTYVLQVTVSGNTPNYSWVAITPS